jgi:hypothetical protein
MKERSHPVKLPVYNEITNERKLPELYNALSFNTNLYNDPTEALRVLEFGNLRLLSKEVFTYLNNQDNLIIWIRMVLDCGDYTKEKEPFNVDVSINCDNAEGVTIPIIIDPSLLYK